MALLLNDGFGLYNTYAGALQIKGWGGGSTAAPSFSAGRVSTSKSIFLRGTFSGSGFSALSQTLAFSGTTTIIGGAIDFGGSGDGDAFALSCGGSVVNVRFTAAGALAVYKDSTLLAALGTFAIGTWYYLELKVDWATAGRVVVRIDGSVKYDSGAGGVALAAPTTGLLVSLRNYYNTAGFGGINYADVLIMDGSGSTFNGFQGDVTIETLFPTADGATSGWTRISIARTMTTKALTSNVATLNGVNTTAGLSVGDTITVALSPADATFDGTYTLSAVTSSSISYAKVAANVGSTGTGGTFTETSTDHFRVVNEAPEHDADTDYVTTATVNAVDTYAMQNLATSSTSPVLAVRPVLVARKESAAVMGIAAVARSAGTDYPGTATDLPNTLVYTPVSDTLTADPATAAAWTRAAVDAIEVGPKKTS